MRPGPRRWEGPRRSRRPESSWRPRAEPDRRSWSITKTLPRLPTSSAGIERDQGRLDVLVNDIFGGDRYMEWDKPLWEHDWAGGLRMLQMGVHTHLITCRAAIPCMLRTAEALGTRGLVVEMTDGTSQANAEFRRNVGFYYDLVKANVERIVKGLSAELEDRPVTAVGVTPGWLRSEKMLENFGVTEANWRDACRARPGFGISESPTYVARGVAALAEGCGRRAMGRHDRQRSPPR